MLQARGIGIGVLLSLLVLGFFVVLCSLLLIPHLLGRGVARVARGLLARRSSPRPSRSSGVAVLN